MADHFVAFWNVENLFDVLDSPRRTEKLQRTLQGELTGWTQSVLDRKVRQLCSIIVQMNEGKGPDLLGVCEIENRYVLEALRDGLNALNRNYDIVHADAEDHRGIDVAFLYDRDVFTAQETFFHFIVKRYATRDLVQVNFQTAQGNRFVVVGNHWPSRSSGQLESEPYRIIAGETLAYFHQRILEQLGDDTAVLAVGDFNDEPFNRSLVEYALADRQRRKVTQARNPKFFNLMWPIVGQGIGTHYYDNYANVLDQFLANAPLVTGSAGVEIRPDTAKVLRFPEMVSSGYPGPIRFGRGSSLDRDGFSDHYPIAVRVQE
jgi:predicted extracellular nuclease